MCNKLFLSLDGAHPSTTSHRLGGFPPPPGSVGEAALFREMAAKSLEEVGTTAREVLRINAKDGFDMAASKKEGRKLQIFNLTGWWWGLPREDMAHDLICFAA